MSEQDRPRGAGRSTHLTARQLAVARLIALEYTNGEIARALTLAPGTVANHVRAIVLRLGVRSRVGIALWVAEHASGPTAGPSLRPSVGRAQPGPSFETPSV